MEGDCHDPGDKQYGEDLRRGAAQEFAAYVQLIEAVADTDGAVPIKFREQISVAVALTTESAYCLETCVNAAQKAGPRATDRPRRYSSQTRRARAER
jgi:AhpD family alkylhydroperoxidase